jgi:tRNA (guanosine-2'-O-)-methyltransferase
MPFGIGVEHIKREVNIGTLLRSAYCLGAAFVFTVGRRYERQGGDTVKAFRHLPVWHFGTWEEYWTHAPLAWVPVGVEIWPGAEPLETFRHPPMAVYWLGGEDRDLSSEARARCAALVQIPSRHCLNVATAGSIIMYDRQAKRLIQKRELACAS